MNPLRKLKAYLIFNEAVSQADAAHKQYGRRFFVMPSEDGKLIIMDKYDLRRMKVKHYISKNCHVADLMSDAFYFTPLGNGLEGMDPQDRENRRIAFYRWYDLTCKINRIRKRKDSAPEAR